MTQTFTVEAGTYEVSASYQQFSETKTVTVKAGETVTVEFRWYTPPPPVTVPVMATIVVAAYVDDKEVPATVTVRKVA